MLQERREDTAAENATTTTTAATIATIITIATIRTVTDTPAGTHGAMANIRSTHVNMAFSQTISNVCQNDPNDREITIGSYIYYSYWIILNFRFKKIS